MNFTGPLQVTAGQVQSESLTPQYQLGIEGYTRDGGRYRYVKAGLAALVAGQVQQSPAQVALHQGLTVIAPFTEVGGFKIVATNGATAITANQYAGGYAIISAGSGSPLRYQISGNTAAAGAAPVTVTLATDDPLVGNVALTGTSRLSLQASPYSGVIQSPAAALTGAPVGVAVIAIAAGSYGWVQTGGVGVVITTGTPAVGSAIAVPAATAGQVAISAAGLSNVGTILVTGVTNTAQAALLDFP
jgi:hypothetical protein